MADSLELNFSSAYKISLDEIDFNYLTSNNYLLNGDVVKPLWDASKNKEYYDFAIIAEINDKLSQNDESIDELPKDICICHICNVDVPKIYMREHNMSAKHKVCLELANKAMERTRKHIMNIVNQYNDPPISTIPSNTYFCAPCSVAIQNNDKFKHEKTKTHMLSVKHDELLNDLLKIYMCNDSAKTDTEKPLCRTDITKETESVKENGTMFNVKTDKINNKDQGVVNSKNKDGGERETIEKDVYANVTPFKNTEQRDQYPEIHHHMQKTENPKELICKVCKVVVPFIATNIEEHIKGNNHTKNYNMITSRLKRIDNKYYCENCKVFIKVNCEIDHVTEHLTHEAHKKNLQTVNKLNNCEQISTTTNIHKHMEVTDGVLNCRVCRVPVPNNPNCVDKHIVSYNHTTNYNTLISINKLTKSNNDYFCELCRVVLPKDSEIAHVNGVIHKNILAKRPLTSDATANDNSTIQREEPNPILKAYVDILNKMNNSQKAQSLSVINDDFIEINTVNGCKLKVSVKNFHGYHEIDGHTQCRVCRKVVDGITETHKLTEEHIERIMAPINDMNCVRKVDTWSHCILCNEIIENGDIHAIVSKEHNIRLKNALLTSNNSKKRNSETEIVSVHHVSNCTKTYCSVCKIYIDLHNYKSHVNGRSHISKYNENFPKMSQPVDQEMEDIQNLYFHMSKTENPNEMNCKTCKIKVLTSNVDTHLKGFPHRSNYHSLLKDNSIKTVTNGYYCEICDVNITKFDVADHAYSKNHTSKSTSTHPTAIIHHHMKLIDLSNVSCRVCNVSVPNIPFKLTEHTNSSNHKINFNSLISANQLKKLDKRYSCECYFCDVCEISLMEQEEIDHISSLEHKNKLKSKNDSIPKPDSEKTAFHHHMQMTENPKQLLCKVCRVRVPFIAANVEEHVKGTNHAANYNIIISKLKKVDNRYYCECCKQFVKKNYEIDHVATHLSPEEHKKVLQAGNTSNNLEQQSTTNKIHEHMELKGNGVLHCKVCKVPVPNNTNCVSVHVNGSNHKTNCNDLIKMNKLIETNDRYFCEICRVYLTQNAVIAHIFTDKHKNNMTAQPSSSSDSVTNVSKNAYKCIICDVYVPNNAKNIAEHNKGGFHSDNLQKLVDNLANKCTLN